MKIVDKFIIKKFLSAYVFVVLILVTVVCIIQLTEKNDKIIKHQLTIAEVGGYYLDYFPYIANMISPITVFIAVVYITAKMASHSEIIALLSSGISFRRLMWSYLMGAILIAGVNFVLTGWVIPNSNKDRLVFEMQYFENTYYFTDRDIHMKVAPESYLYMESYNNHTEVGYKFTLETIRENNLVDKLSAQRIEWQEDSGSWKLKRWELREFNGFEESFTHGSELDTVLNISPKDFDSDFRLYEALTINELNEHIRLLESRGADNVEFYEIEKYTRFTSPFAMIILTFIGMIMSARKTRGGAGFQIALGFLIAFIYIIFFWFSKTFAESGNLAPEIAIWIPNSIFAVVGIILYKTVPR
ncbi:LptF/LptG family permease [Bacteroidota bacterium]